MTPPDWLPFEFDGVRTLDEACADLLTIARARDDYNLAFVDVDPDDGELVELVGAVTAGPECEGRFEVFVDGEHRFDFDPVSFRGAFLNTTRVTEAGQLGRRGFCTMLELLETVEAIRISEFEVHAPGWERKARPGTPVLYDPPDHLTGPLTTECEGDATLVLIDGRLILPLSSERYRGAWLWYRDDFFYLDVDSGLRPQPVQISGSRARDRA